MSWTFTPPTTNITPAVGGDATPIQARLFRYYNARPHGITVWRRGGVWYSDGNQADPSDYDLRDADVIQGVQLVFLGGHVHTIEDQAVHDALVAGGFTLT